MFSIRPPEMFQAQAGLIWAKKTSGAKLEYHDGNPKGKLQKCESQADFE